MLIYQSHEDKKIHLWILHYMQDYVFTSSSYYFQEMSPVRYNWQMRNWRYALNEYE